MTRKQIIEQLRSSEDRISSDYHARSLAIFGSYARGDQKVESDLDILYEVTDRSKFGLLEIDGLESYLKKHLSIDAIDLVDKQYVNPIIEIEIEDDLVCV